MKTYTFAKLQARPYPTLAEIDNPYIYGSARYVVNVSEKEYPDKIAEAFTRKGITFRHFPLHEEDGMMDIGNILQAVQVLAQADREDMRAIIHCDGGNNRSRVVAELFHHLKMGFLPEDEYKGYRNHVEYNIATGHLPANTLEVITSLPDNPGLSDPDDH